MIDFLVGDGCLRTPWQWDLHTEFAVQCVICIAPLAVLPLKRYDRIKAFGWLEHPSGCDEEIPPTFHTGLDLFMDVIECLILGQINMQKVRVIDV